MMIPKNLVTSLGNETSAPSNLLYFFHIPKTAGTSLHHAFRDQYGPEAVSPQWIWDDFLATGRRISASTRVLVGHFGGLLPFYLGYIPMMVTLLRDPISRALSHINHVQRDPNHPLHEVARNLSLLEYCRHPDLRRTIDNTQSRYLASLCFAEALMTRPSNLGDQHHGHFSVAFENALSAMDGRSNLAASAIKALNRMECFGICEEFNRSLAHFAEVLRWSKLVVPTVVNVAGPSQKKRKELSFRENRELRSLNRIDSEVYDWASSHFAARCSLKRPQRSIFLRAA